MSPLIPPQIGPPQANPHPQCTHRHVRLTSTRAPPAARPKRPRRRRRLTPTRPSADRSTVLFPAPHGLIAARPLPLLDNEVFLDDGIRPVVAVSRISSAKDGCSCTKLSRHCPSSPPPPSGPPLPLPQRRPGLLMRHEHPVRRGSSRMRDRAGTAAEAPHHMDMLPPRPHRDIRTCRR